MPYEFVRSPQSGVQLSFFGLRELFSHHIVLSLDVIRKGSSASCVLTEAQLDTCRRTKRSVYKNLFTRRTPLSDRKSPSWRGKRKRIKESLISE